MRLMLMWYRIALWAGGETAVRPKQISVILTICQGNHFQEITVGCCRITVAIRTACRKSAPEATRNCATSVSHEACISPKSRPSFFHLYQSGKWVEDASQKRCCAISTYALVLLLHSPLLKAMTSWNQGNPGQIFAVTVEHGIDCSAFRQTVVIQTVVCYVRPLFCSNIQVCSHVFQRSHVP